MVAESVGLSGSNRLVVFDVEGVLLPKRRYLLFEASGRLGLWRFIKILVTGLLYEIGLLSVESTLKRIFKLFRGLTVDDLFQLFRKIPLIPGTAEVFERLNRAGYRTAVISSGLPRLFVEDLAARLNADYAYGLELETTNGHLTGEIGGDVIKPNGKALVLTKIMEGENLSRRDCVVVADDRNNLPMFPLCALRIGYSPDFMVSAKSDLVVEGDLSEILPPIIEKTSKVPYPVLSKTEVFREVIHLSGFLVPLVCVYLLDRYVVSLLMLLVTLLYIASELARLEGINVPIFSTITWRAAIKPELYEFVTAPIFFALGIMISLTLFPVPINYASIMILALGDGFATLFGKTLGRTVLPINKGKRVEGSFFGVLFAFLGALPFVNPMQALVGAAIGMLVECLPLPISDNITVPIASGLAMMAVP
ncbi:MAG: HAD-IB family phosphatase [Candidatus Bathyarchaeia archaeon]